MIKFYYSTATSTLMSALAFEEAGLEKEAKEVSWQRDLNVGELNDLNPLGLVPVIVTSDGKTVTQNTAILEYIADQKPEKNLLGKAGSSERAQAISWISFAAAEFQKSFLSLNRASEMTSNETAQKDIKAYALKNIRGYLSYIDQSLAGKDFLVGNQFSMADIAVFTFLGWCNWYEINTSEYKNVKGFLKRVSSRPAIQKVLQSEDLVEDYI
jgi:glutathione S-transferase